MGCVFFKPLKMNISLNRNVVAFLGNVLFCVCVCVCVRRCGHVFTCVCCGWYVWSVCLCMWGWTHSPELMVGTEWTLNYYYYSEHRNSKTESGRVYRKPSTWPGNYKLLSWRLNFLTTISSSISPAIPDAPQILPGTIKKNIALLDMSHCHIILIITATKNQITGTLSQHYQEFHTSGQDTTVNWHKRWKYLITCNYLSV